MNSKRKSSQTQQSRSTLLPSVALKISSRITALQSSDSNSTPTQLLISWTSPSLQLHTSSIDHRLSLSTKDQRASSQPTSPLLRVDLKTRETLPSPPFKSRVKVRTLALPSSPRCRASRTPSWSQTPSSERTDRSSTIMRHRDRRHAGPSASTTWESAVCTTSFSHRRSLILPEECLRRSKESEAVDEIISNQHFRASANQFQTNI